MCFLSEDKILEFVNEYIDDKKSRYAILIDGEWGCGKTFFVKNVLIPFINNEKKTSVGESKEKEQKKVIYLSLYGISSCEEISKMIFMEAMPFKDVPLFDKSNSAYGKISTVTKTIFAGGLSYLNVTLPKVEYTELLQIDKYIMILDDLERCNMNINEVLGYINNFVEHDGVKTIIVSNQKEIGKINIATNTELKYLLTLRDNIDFPDMVKEKENNLRNSINSGKNISPLSIEKMNSRVEYLFANNILFAQIKEKLIGVTIYYKPNIETMLKVLANEYVDNNMLRNAIVTSTDFVKDNCERYNHTNLRTVIFAIRKYEKIGDVVLSCDLGKNIQEKILEQIFQYCFKLSIKTKLGEKAPNWGKESEYGNIYLNTELSALDYILGFKFVDDYVIRSEFCKERISNIITNYSKEVLEQTIDQNDPIVILKNRWWELEDNVLLELIEEIEHKLEENSYEFSQYTNIISQFLLFKNIGFPINISKYLDVMESNIVNSKRSVKTELSTYGLFVDESIREEFYAYITQLKECVKEYNNKLDISNINSFFINNDNWAERFFDYVKENKNKFLSEKKFFELIDVDKAFNCIVESNNAQIIEFRNSICEVYNFSNLDEFFLADKEKIQKISDKLHKYESEGLIDGIIRKYNIGILIKKLDDSLKRLSA